jgi:mannose-6-phosphate isomerase-like protein (cupin superfamily)
MAFHTNIEKDTLENINYRKVINTSNNIQLVLMSLKPNEEIGKEVHNNIDQFFRIEQGTAKVIVNNQEIILKDGSALVVPKGTIHNIINIGNNDLKLYTIYSPPNHPKNTIQTNKQDGGYLKYKNKYLKLKNKL